MRHGIGRLRAGGSGAFTPGQISFGAGGIWLDQSDMSSGFQDSAGTTPITASGQFVGKRLDKSGTGNHFTQSTASARPEWDVISSISSDFSDGVNDGYSTSTFAAGTFTNNMDLYVAVKFDSGTGQSLFSDTPAAAKLLVVRGSGGSGSVGSSIGSNWLLLVNGVTVGTTGVATSGQMFTATPTGTWCVVELRNLDLSTWTQFTFAAVTGLFSSADVGGLVVCPTLAAATGLKVRTYLGSKVGLSL